MISITNIDLHRTAKEVIIAGNQSGIESRVDTGTGAEIMIEVETEIMKGAEIEDIEIEVEIE